MRHNRSLLGAAGVAIASNHRQLQIRVQPPAESGAAEGSPGNCIFSTAQLWTSSFDVEHDHVVAAEGDVDGFTRSRRSRAPDIERVDVQDFGAEADLEPHDRA